MVWARSGWWHGAPVALASLLLAAGVRAEVEVPEQHVSAPGGAGHRRAEQSGAEQSGAEHGGPDPGGWLRWEGPIECQNTREVERQLESLLGYAPAAERLLPTRVEVGWGSARGWALRIRVSLPQGERRREVVVRTCADGFDVVALTLALILDPELGLGAELGGEPLSDSDALEPVASAGPAEPAAAGMSALPAAPPVEAEPVESLDSLAQSPVSLVDGRPALRLSAGGRADLGTLPAALFGGGGSVSFSAWHWRVDLGAAYLGRGAQSLPLATYDVSYTNVLGMARGCRELSPRGGGRFDVCLGGQLGSLAVEELGGERRQGRGLWAAAAVGAELGLELTEAWGAFSGVELVFPLARHELALSGGAVVHEVPAVSLQLTLGAVVRLTEAAAP